MRRQEEKGKAHFRKRLIIVALSFLFFILFIASFFGRNGLLEMYRSRKRHDELVMEVQKFRKDKANLEREIEELGRNPEAVEKTARQKLWLMEPDELVIIKRNKEEKKKEKEKSDKRPDK